MDYGEYLVDAVDLVVTDPVQNIRRVREDRQSNHDNFSVDEMKAILCF